MVKIWIATGLALVTLLGAGPAATAPADEWAELRRPLDLPRVAAGATCPVSRVDRSVDWFTTGVGGGIGRGPVYAILGETATLGAGLRGSEWGSEVWGGQKVLWYVHERYRGPVLIRGRRLDGWQWMRFDRGPMPSDELRLARGETVSWTGQRAGARGRPSYVRVRAAGCYGAQIDGTSFSRVVVFRVVFSR